MNPMHHLFESKEYKDFYNKSYSIAKKTVENLLESSQKPH
jgi:hypothetical protein